MKNYTFLALQGPDGTTAELAPLTEAATNHSGRLSVLHLGPVPIMPYTMMTSPYGAPAIPEGWISQRREMAEMLAEKQSKTREYLKREGLTGEVSTICIEPAAFHDMVAVRAIFADVSVVLNSLRKDKTVFDNVVYGLLFEAPGPVILNTEADTKALAPENVFVAWNNSLPAIRAVRAALPLLKAAKEVTIACFDADSTQYADGESPGSDLATWLSHHGCKITVQEYNTGHHSVAEAMRARAHEQTANLIVMGAYGRSRWNERFFGGTTETMTQQQDFPILLNH
ncbi:universal stress protein [Yoonia sp.]|uniref:universal stress protein n=1 Tax=Yoonia sp. TaxID=2212373 RepID=UPI0039754033